MWNINISSKLLNILLTPCILFSGLKYFWLFSQRGFSILCNNYKSNEINHKNINKIDLNPLLIYLDTNIINGATYEHKDLTEF